MVPKKWILVLLLQLLLSKSITVSSIIRASQQNEVTTNRNENDVLCVSPRVKDAVRPLRLLLDLEGKDGWRLKQSEDSAEKSVIDQRWEDFETRFTNYLHYKFKKSFALSTYNASKLLKMRLYDDDLGAMNITINTDELWNHISVVFNRNELQVFSCNSLVRKSAGFEPTNLIVMTQNETFFKIHNYTFLYSNISSERPTEVRLPPAASCVAVYVSLCPSCYLHVGNDRFEYEEGWQWREVVFNSSQQTFQIFRGSDNCSNNGRHYWEVDIRKCTTFTNECKENEWVTGSQSECNGNKCEFCDEITEKCTKQSIINNTSEVEEINTTEDTVLLDRTEGPRISPQNLRLFWTLQNDLELSWNYSSSFGDAVETFIVIMDCENREVSVNFNITRNSTSIYKRKISSEKFVPSRRYNISVGIYHNSVASNVSAEETSPPGVPLFVSEPQLRGLRASIAIKISPEIENIDYTNNYKMFIFVKDTNTNAVPTDLQEFQEIFRMDLSALRILYDCRIKNLTEAVFVLGESHNLNANCINYAQMPLEDKTAYNITIVLKSTDRYNKSSYKLYTYKQETLDTLEFSFLTISILVIIVILIGSAATGAFIGRMFSSKREIQEETFLMVPITQNAGLPREEYRADTTDFLPPVRRELFETYVKDGIRKKIFVTQYEKILHRGSELCYETPPGSLLWDHIDINFQEQQFKNTYIVSDLSNNAGSYEFWLQVWRENVESIVLVTDANDDQQKEKVHRLFPERGVNIIRGNILIQCVSCISHSDYEERQFRMSREQFHREISLLSFISWTANSAVSSLTITPFLRKILAISDKTNTPVVVISGGNGKALGFVLLCSIALQNAKSTGNVDVGKIFFEISKHQLSVSASQYILAHFVILENLIYTDTRIKGRSLEVRPSAASCETMCFHLQLTKKMLWLDRCVEALRRTGEDKEALNDTLSAICGPEVEHEYVYIDNQNIQMIDGLRGTYKFITVPQPNKHSSFDFWKLVIEENAKVIVSLNKSSESHSWWPNDNNNSLNLSDDIRVQYRTKKQFKIYTWVTVSLETEEMQTTIEIFLVKNWSKKSNCPHSMRDFLDFIIETKRIVQLSTCQIVTCCDGKKACGLYLALSFALEKIMLEGTNDICSIVRYIKSHHKEFLKTDTQFIFLWKATEVFLKESQSYVSVY